MISEIIAGFLFGVGFMVAAYLFAIIAIGLSYLLGLIGN